MQEDTLDMLYTELVHQTRWEHSRRKGTSEDGTELCIQAPDSHVFELEIGREDGVRGSPTLCFIDVSNSGREGHTF